MASATTHHRRSVLGQLAVLLMASLVVMAAAAAAASGCESEKFPAGSSYATCSDLPTLGAALHWTYDAAASSLSIAFVAAPDGASGWVAWGINPTGDGMKGAQTLVAFKGASSGAYAVNTYNLTGYRPLGAASSPIAFKATDLAADESGGKVRLYGKLQLPEDMEAVNHIWQVGSAVAAGAPVKHAFAKENLEAKGKLVLAGGGGAEEPAPAPLAGGPSTVEAAAGTVETQTTSSPVPAGGKNSSTAASTYASAPVLMVLAFAGFLVTMIS